MPTDGRRDLTKTLQALFATLRKRLKTEIFIIIEFETLFHCYVYADGCYNSYHPGIAKLLEPLQPMARNVFS